MRVDTKKYAGLMKKQKIDKSDVERITGIKPHTMDWILEHGFVEFHTLETLSVAVNCKLRDIVMADYSFEDGEYGSNENVIEWITNSDYATITVNQGSTKSRIKKLAGSRPQDCFIVAENQCGSLCARIPRSWVKINPSLELSEEERLIRAERARKNFAESTGQEEL